MIIFFQSFFLKKIQHNGGCLIIYGYLCISYSYSYKQKNKYP